MSFMNMTNNTGPSAEPCGILVTLVQLETDHSTTTLWHLPERNDFISTPEYSLGCHIFQDY